MPLTVPRRRLWMALDCTNCEAKPCSSSSRTHHIRAFHPRSSSMRSRCTKNAPANASGSKIILSDVRVHELGAMGFGLDRQLHEVVQGVPNCVMTLRGRDEQQKASASRAAE